MPPWVGSGCRQTSVATGAWSRGSDRSPGSATPSPVRRVTRSRRAGRIVLALISLMRVPSAPLSPAALSPAAPLPAALSPGGPVVTLLPAGPVPVPALAQPGGQRGPGHQVRRAGRDFLIASGATIALHRGGARHEPDHPVLAVPRLLDRRAASGGGGPGTRSEEHTSELQSPK